MTKINSDAPVFELQISDTLGDETLFSGTSLTSEPVSVDGRFRTVWRCLDGTLVTHRHSWSTGMGSTAKIKAYSDRFRQELPSWARPMPPITVWRLCEIALRTDRPLPAACPKSEGSAATFIQIAAIGEGAVRFTGR